MPEIAPITDANPTVDEMEGCVARFARLRPTDAYVDAALPGCERTTFPVLGHGPHAPLHSHLTQEVFIPLTGTWEVFWGPRGERSLRLGAWDTISIPPGLSRGFRNVGDGTRG